MENWTMAVLKSIQRPRFREYHVLEHCSYHVKFEHTHGIRS